MTFGIQTITGRILSVGAATFDSHCHTYEDIEVETSEGVVKFGPVLAASLCDEVLEPHRKVTMTVTQTTGRGARLVVWAVLDKESGRVYANAELFSARQAALAKAFWFSLFAPVYIPVGLMLAVLPGLAAMYLLWKGWAAVLMMPSSDEVKAAVAALSNSRPTEHLLLDSRFAAA